MDAIRACLGPNVDVRGPSIMALTNPCGSILIGLVFMLSYGLIIIRPKSP